MKAEEMKDETIVGSVIVVALAIAPVPPTFPRFENSRNVEMQNRHGALGNGRE